MNPLIVSPPFGNYFPVTENVTPVIGTFTLNRRPGLIRQVLKTVRPRERGWINAIGLRNPGIYAGILNGNPANKIVSVAGSSKEEWEGLANFVRCFSQIEAVELNLSCPNTGYEVGLLDIFKLDWGPTRVIVKLAPEIISSLMTIETALRYDISWFHCFNSLPIANGGYSGPRLQEFSIPLIKLISEMYKNKITIIGGGGIQNADDIKQYRDLGLRYFSMSSAFFNPIRTLVNWKSIIKEINK